MNEILKKMNINFLGFTFKKMDKKKSLDKALDNLEELVRSSSHVLLFNNNFNNNNEIEICRKIILS